MSTKTADFNLLSSMDARRAAHSTFQESAIRRPKSRFALWSSLHLRLQASMIAQFAVGFLAVFLITEFFLHGPTANTTTVGFAYLLAILAASTCLELRATSCNEHRGDASLRLLFHTSGKYL
jgi:hypothetical protein